MKKSRIGVTDHAVLRYMERVMGVDVERLRREIGRRADCAADHPGCNRVISANVRLVIENEVVVTVTTPRAPRRQRAGRR